MDVFIPIPIPAGPTHDQFPPVSQMDGKVCKPRGVDQEGDLAREGIKTDHIPQQPRLSSREASGRDSVGRCNLPSLDVERSGRLMKL